MLQEFSHWLLLLIATDAVEALCPISRDVRGKGRNDAMIIAKARKREFARRNLAQTILEPLYLIGPNALVGEVDDFGRLVRPCCVGLHMSEAEAGNAVESFTAWPRPGRSKSRPTGISDGQLIVMTFIGKSGRYVPLDSTYPHLGKATYNMYAPTSES